MTRRSWREGRRYVAAIGGLGAALLLLGRRSGWPALGVAALVAAFFRDPERRLEPDSRLVYAAADGVVTGIDGSAHDEWMPGRRAIRITTFLGLQNVHVNRSPVAGRLTTMQAVPGGFAPALFAHARDNTRNRLAIDGDVGRVVVVQVAGLLARTISPWVRQGQLLVAGERIGMIHFGSRTDVLLPVGSADVLVRQGQRVRAGATPLARYRTRA